LHLELLMTVVVCYAVAISKMENMDEVWRKASERFPTSTTAWLKNFAGDLNRAKRAIADALKVGGDSGRRVLRHQLDNDANSGGKSEAEDAVALIRLMAEQPKMTALISSYLSDRRSSANNPRGRDNHMLHVAAKTGCVADLRRVMSREHVDVLNADLETPLHLAAEFDHVDDVRILLEFGATMRADRHGCTPLHSAALSIRPNATIAGLLVRAAAERGDYFRLLNE